jgi:hypothetical protein
MHRGSWNNVQVGSWVDWQVVKELPEMNREKTGWLITFIWTNRYLLHIVKLVNLYLRVHVKERL